MSTRTSKARLVVLGGAVGALTAHFLDPDRGRARRRTTRDRTAATARHAARRAQRTTRRSAARAHGLWLRLVHLLAPRHRPPADDVELAHKVESIIYRNPHVPKGRFNVNAERGVVFLRGQLDGPQEIELVEQETRRVPGVVDVRNLLHLPGTSAPPA